MAGKDKDTGQNTARDRDNVAGQDMRADGAGTTGRAEASEFESGLDYGAFVEDDAPDTVTSDALDAPDQTGYRSDPGTQATQSIDRAELEALAAGDARVEGGAGNNGTAPQDRPAARARGERAGIVTATVTPEPAAVTEPTPTAAWAAGPALAPTAPTAAPLAAPAAATPAVAATQDDHHGFNAGGPAADDEDRRRDLRGAEARAAARDEALEGPSTAPKVFQVLLAIFFPIVVLIAAVRAVASPAFLWLEYHRPGFPSDPHGFTTEDRLTYGSAGMDYLFNVAPPRYLGDLQHQGGQLFTDTEVSHMADVKLVMLITMAVGTVLVLACIVFMVSLARTAKGGIRRSLFAGSVWMLVVLIALVVLAVLGWEQFFAGFHSLFFADGTWTFRATDSLIRLYPNQFWMDAGLAVGVLVLLTLVITLVCTWPTRRRRQDSQLAQVDMVRRRNEWYDARA
jgi:integral membrane protein (TIGR01906 family)